MVYLETKYFSYANPEDSRTRKVFIRSIEYFSGQPKLYKLYRDYQKNPQKWESFWDGCMDKLELNVQFDKSKIKNIPKEGPLVIVDNHPFGVLDGLVICWISKMIRNEFKVLTHALLLRAPETKGYLLPIDFSGTREALMTNIETRKTARSFLDDGGTIVVFPGGTVSTTNTVFTKEAYDPKWRNFTARLIKQSKATIVPIYFYGQNSRLFHLASHISETLRSALLFHEVRRRINSSVPLIIGDPIEFNSLEKNITNDELSNYLRSLTYKLNPIYKESDIPFGKDFAEF